LSEKFFALTLRVIVRCIKEVDAAVNRRLDQFIGPGLANGADGLEDSSAVPECHGSEAEFRNQEASIAERCVFHDAPPIVEYLRGCRENKGYCSQGSSCSQGPPHAMADEAQASVPEEE
jgi:hypothetical protein